MARRVAPLEPGDPLLIGSSGFGVVVGVNQHEGYALVHVDSGRKDFHVSIVGALMGREALAQYEVTPEQLQLAEAREACGYTEA